MKKIFLFCCLLFFLKCAPVNLSLKPEYENTDFRGSSCAVVVLGDIKIDYRGDVENEFGKGDQNELIKKYFFENFPVYLKDNSLFSDVYSDSCITPYSLDSIPVNTGFSIKNLLIPDSGTILNFVQGTPDYVFFLEDLEIRSIPSVDIIMINMIPVGAIPYKPLTYKAQFVLWDNRTGMIAGQGKALASKTTGVSVILETWQCGTDTFAAEIIKNTRLQYPLVDEVNLQTIDCNDIPEKCNTFFWQRSSARSELMPVLVQNKSKSMAYLKINDELFALRRDAINKNDTLKKRTYYIGDTLIENYQYKYVRMKMITFIKSLCKEDPDGKKYDTYSTTMYLTFAKKRKTYYLRGKKACEN